jgi:hypothetical protein
MLDFLLLQPLVHAARPIPFSLGRRRTLAAAPAALGLNTFRPGV